MSASFLLPRLSVYLTPPQVALSVWRDEAKGIVNGKGPIPDEDPDAGSDDEVNLPRDVPVASSREGSPSRGPPTSGSEAEDDFDLDAAIREEEELERIRAQSGGAKKATAATDDMDDEAFWAELAQSSGVDVDGIAGPSAPKAPAQPAKAAPAQVTEDELWEEMDDMMDMDMDEPINFNKSSAASAPAASSSTASKAPEQTPAAAAVVEDDWDDLYTS
jgi:replication fork protection complex subunit Csm3/Swi3